MLSFDYARRGKRMTLLFKKRSNQEEEDKQLLVKEIRKAHLEWLAAQMRLDWVLEHDEIDYAVYAMEAAEKKYEMLLRQAKKLNWDKAPFSVHEPVDSSVPFLRTYHF
ncbi:DUF2508 domain-containing protein [Paenibacillus contaminans]|uniref:DUF2508 domain-containing protein n=2 Tax=Paenibacillus contaminans TaxID=450362 RepID=A0A329LX60_9BACL|nr:DUF2508 domain-containing protein [Paenibacillus contaminans]